MNILESRNMVFSGTLVQNGEARVLVCGTGMSTQIGSIVELTKATDVAEAPIHRELRHFIRIISTIAISLGVLFFLVSIAIGKGEIGSLIFAIGECAGGSAADGNAIVDHGEQAYGSQECSHQEP